MILRDVARALARFIAAVYEKHDDARPPDSSPPGAVCTCTHLRREHCGCGSVCMAPLYGKPSCACPGFRRNTP